MLSIPVAAQETTTATDLRAVIEDLRDGELDNFDAAPKLSKAIRKQKSRTRKRFKSFGEVEAIAFWETFEGIDLYVASFEHARVVLAFARDDDGTIGFLRYRAVLTVS